MAGWVPDWTPLGAHHWRPSPGLERVPPHSLSRHPHREAVKKPARKRQSSSSRLHRKGASAAAETGPSALNAAEQAINAVMHSEFQGPSMASVRLANDWWSVWRECWQCVVCFGVFVFLESFVFWIFLHFCVLELSARVFCRSWLLKRNLRPSCFFLVRCGCYIIFAHTALSSAHKSIMNGAS